ncbi:ImmA/IrrE family metallo-endopeptidase [Anaerorhabdus sp.]|uniref:ImmA/IrrE family metallo-endopeptidase n=1 Tax=Anaerorhabdus sp. TaxID=1872524 RepID=UPI002B1FD97A|nr:ImmA/IrrE family metallo-endopeptidase [Anaerorhabdus sp.]MEA4875405.1 ImmA/IrrE family metallo-endopeptidase [Anaerorhabdus sp.]
MKIEEIKKVVQTINSSNIYELLKENNLNVVYSDILNNRKLDATLFENIILIKSNLTPEYEQFILYHELGHFLLHFQSEERYSFYLSKYKNRIENEANIFSFLCLTRDMDLTNTNIIELSVQLGIPSKIASKIYEYMLLSL